jgi:hypothetical protein
LVRFAVEGYDCSVASAAQEAVRGIEHGRIRWDERGRTLIRAQRRLFETARSQLVRWIRELRRDEIEKRISFCSDKRRGSATRINPPVKQAGSHVSGQDGESQVAGAGGPAYAPGSLDLNRKSIAGALGQRRKAGAFVLIEMERAQRISSVGTAH